MLRRVVVLVDASGGDPNRRGWWIATGLLSWDVHCSRIPLRRSTHEKGRGRKWAEEGEMFRKMEEMGGRGIRGINKIQVGPIIRYRRYNSDVALLSTTIFLGSQL